MMVPDAGGACDTPKEGVTACRGLGVRVYTLHPTIFTLHPTPYTLHPTPHTSQPTPSTLHPKPYTACITPRQGVTPVHSSNASDTTNVSYRGTSLIRNTPPVKIPP